MLLKYTVASLFRVTWGFLAAAVLAIPLGLTIGWYRRAEIAFNPLIQILRPISPLAWIPIAILWLGVLGVGDVAAVFLIFVSCFFPIAPDRYECGAKRSIRLRQCGTQFWVDSCRPHLPCFIPRSDATVNHGSGPFLLQPKTRAAPLVANNPLDRVMYTSLAPRKADFDMVRDLMVETGVLD